MTEHTLIDSTRYPGRFALDCKDSRHTLACGLAITLRLDGRMVDGCLEGNGESWYFVPEGVSWFTCRIVLEQGMSVWI